MKPKKHCKLAAHKAAGFFFGRPRSRRLAARRLAGILALALAMTSGLALFLGHYLAHAIGSTLSHVIDAVIWLAAIAAYLSPLIPPA